MESNAQADVSADMKALSEHMASAITGSLQGPVIEKTKHHIADSIAAIVSGSRLPPGLKGISFSLAQGDSGPATVMGTRHRLSVMNATFANAMSAHADETDDSHQGGFFHPGCAVIPAAWACAEAQASSGLDLIRAVALGYDIGARISMSLGAVRFHHLGHSSHSFGALFGAAAAAGALMRLNPRQMRHLLSYTAQQASGVSCWMRDPDHIEKAFDFAAMPARNGVASALLVAHGFTGVEDVFEGPRNFWEAFQGAQNRALLTQDLGSVQEIMRSNIKKWSVGSPIQPPLDAVEHLMRTHDFRAQDVEHITVEVQDSEWEIVNHRTMPDICLQYLVAVMLLDGRVGFAAAHDVERMGSPEAVSVMKKIVFKGNAELTRSGGRQAIVEIHLTNGQQLRHHTPVVPGAWQKPLSRVEVEEKFLDLVAPVLGQEAAAHVISRLWSLEDEKSLNGLLG